jgi:hypothetical protein
MRRFVGNWPLIRPKQQVLIQRLEQYLSAGQRDVGAFEANIRSSAFGHSRGNEIIDVCHKTKSAPFEKNAACGGGMGRHDFLDRYR